MTSDQYLDSHKQISRSRVCKCFNMSITIAHILLALIAWSHIMSILAHESIEDDGVLGSETTTITTISATTVTATNQQAVDSSQLDMYANKIPVNIQMKPAHYLHGKNYIATNVNLSATAEILDDKFKNATMEFQWSVKNKTIATRPDASEIFYKFDHADDDNFLEVLVLRHPNDTGSSQKILVVRDPITVELPNDQKLFLKHGELLDISLKLNGTGPYGYCYKFCLEKKTWEDECQECSPDTMTEYQQVTIVKYLHRVGNYTLLFVADNIASRVTKSYTVRISDTIRPKTIPFVPIVSSVLAVIIVLSGVALHMKFKRSSVTETADFDFIRHDYNEEDDFLDEEQSFLQRVRYLLFKAGRDQDASMSDSVLSATDYRY